MRTHSWKPEIIALIISTVFIMAFLILLSLSARADNCISASMSETEYKVDNSGGLTSEAFEPELTIRNDCGSPTNITLAFTHPNGENTRATKQVYPHFFSDERRRNDREMEYSVQVEEGTTTFYPLIESNDSAFADLYSFECQITNDDNDDDDGGSKIEPIPMTVEVTKYNDIRIELLYSDDRQKTIRPGSETEYYFKLINRGNIYRQSVSVEIENHFPMNISVFDPELPSDRSSIDPDFFSDDPSLIIAVKFAAVEDAGPDTYSFQITPDTPGYEPNSRGHPSVEVRLTVIKEPQPPPPVPVTDEPFPLYLIISALVSVLLLSGGILHVRTRLRKDADLTEYAANDPWESDDWGNEDEDSTFDSPEDLETPITGSHTGPSFIPPRKTTRATSGQVSSSIPIRPSSSTTTKSPSSPSMRSSSSTPGKTHSTTSGLPVRISCPKCSIKLKITNPRRPLVIRCPTCQAKINLKGKSKNQQKPLTPVDRNPAKKKPTPSPAGSATRFTVRIICPSCTVKIKVTNPKRPLRISCPKCTATLKLK